MHLLPLMLLVAALGATANQQNLSTVAPVTLPGCPDKCGQVSIPYPFGTKDGCFLPGFQITCNDTFDPPRTFFTANLSLGWSNKPQIQAEDLYYYNNGGEITRSVLTDQSLSPVELTGVSVGEGKLRVLSPISYDCIRNKTYHSVRQYKLYFPYMSPFLLPQTDTVLMGLGAIVEAQQHSGPSCQSYINPISFLTPVEGECSGQGCCQQTILPKSSSVGVSIGKDQDEDAVGCTYAMVIEKSWYKFTSKDLYQDTFTRRNPRGVPVVVDFVIAGAICCLFIVALLAFIALLRREKRRMRQFFEKNGGPALEKAKNIKIYRKEELKPIIRSNHFIGKGCFGEVYKGSLDNQIVAVKKPINDSVGQNEQFANEVIIQSQVIHKNIVRLIGCCLEVNSPMLVYEFLSKGSLDDALHRNNKVPLDMDMRLNIAAESAEGLAYMHSKTGKTILHGDVKPANILLNENYVPKISDFGISRLILRDKEQAASIIGDKTYMDPIYLQIGLLTEKSDVYSFGVVLLELISRMKATYSDNNSLVRNFLDAHKRGKLPTDLFDKEFAETRDLELLSSLTGLAMECLNLDVDERPSMEDVAERLLIWKRSRK